jgi:hypothetical protein
MSKTIGPREAALRAQREADNKSVAKIVTLKLPAKRKAKCAPTNSRHRAK